ncbi:MAG TPA: peptidoglycan-binding domain-containing protein, partial [Methylomirabilota bacterium]|nr:peptidoglycan-binding domain-containing protein [Methylomirabilota bacterium]
MAVKSVGSITSEDYIAWVQRSLNRILGCGLITNGVDTPEYREQVKEFKYGYLLGSSGTVGVAEQNALITANAHTYEYVNWVKSALDHAGVTSSLRQNGDIDKDTKEAIKSFQAYSRLKDDGVVGARTETALLELARAMPPGHLKQGPKPPPKPSTPPARPITVDPLTMPQRLDRVLGAVLYELQYNTTLYPNTQQRRSIKCLLLKLRMLNQNRRLDGKRIDDRFIPVGASGFPRWFVFGKGVNSYDGGATPDNLAISALGVLRLQVGKLSLAERTNQETLRRMVIHLSNDIAGGLLAINALHGIYGDDRRAAAHLNKW